MNTTLPQTSAGKNSPALLSLHETLEWLNGVQNWNLKDTDPPTIYKVFPFNNFKESVAFINAIGAIAEVENHHPDLHVTSKKLTIELTTHSVNGLSAKDFMMAARIDQLQRPGGSK